jgi:hypothetical protein
MITDAGRVPIAVRDFLVDLLLPASDGAVAVQWAVMVPFWIVVLTATRRRSRDIRTFVLGLAMANLAWFAARTIH